MKLVKGTCDVALGVSAGGQLGASTCPHAQPLWPKLPTPWGISSLTSCISYLELLGVIYSLPRSLTPVDGGQDFSASSCLIDL